MTPGGDKESPASHRVFGCFGVVVLGATVLVFLAFVAEVGMDLCSRRGVGAAVSSFRGQRDEGLALIGRVPLPSGAVPDQFGMGELRIQQVGNDDEARAAFVRAQHPVRDLLDGLCFDTCPGRWVPDDGLIMNRDYQVASSSGAVVCAEVGRRLTQVFGSIVQPEAIAAEYGGIACGFSGRVHNAVLLVSVLHAHVDGLTAIEVEVGTRGYSCAVSDRAPRLRPECRTVAGRSVIRQGKK